MCMAKTTIQIENKTRDRLKSIGSMEDTYDSLLEKLIEFYEEAKRRGWRTAGVGSKKAYGFEWFPVDEKPIIVGEDWGDESETFLSMIDALVRIGGNKQSKEETDVMKKIGAYVLEYDLPLLD